MQQRGIPVWAGRVRSIAMGGRLWYNELVYRNRTSSWQELVESNCRPLAAGREELLLYEERRFIHDFRSVGGCCSVHLLLCDTAGHQYSFQRVLVFHHGGDCGCDGGLYDRKAGKDMAGTGGVALRFSLKEHKPLNFWESCCFYCWLLT